MVVGEISTGVDVLVIGGGPAGYLAAIRAAQLDQDVMLVDRNESLGGVCLNDGCIPSKALIHAADLFHEAGHAEEIGIETDPAVQFDTLQEWRQAVVDKLTGGVKLLEEKHGVEVITGEAYLQSDSHARISGSGDAEAVDFEHCIVATGSTPIELEHIPVDGETVITSKEALRLDAAPEQMVVIGGGYIGMELGFVYQKFGSDVTVLEAGDGILQGNPRDLVKPIRERAEALGMDIHTNATAQDASVDDGAATVTAEIGNETEEFEADAVLVAVGRTPNSTDLGLENAGVEIDEHGFIVTDEQMRATDSIFAVGDVAGQPMLAHKGYMEGKVAAEVIAGKPSAMDATVPAVIYTDPELATVGMTEAEAQENGFDVITGSFSFGASGRAATMAEDAGKVMVVAEAESGALLGAHMVGPNVSEMVPEATLAIEMGALLEDVSMTIHPHPTLSEAFKEACEDALGEAIHKYNPGREDG